MAKKVSKQNHKQPSVSSVVAAPPDYEDITERDIELAGWWHCEEGAVLHGVVRKRFQFETKNGTANALVVQLLEGAKAKEDDETIAVAVGDHVGLLLRASLRKLWQYEYGAKIWLRAERQVEITGGRRMWEFTVKTHGQATSAPIPSPAQSEKRGGGQGFDSGNRPPMITDDDLPF